MTALLEAQVELYLIKCTGLLSWMFLTVIILMFNIVCTCICNKTQFPMKSNHEN